MKLTRSLLAIAITFTLSSAAFIALPARTVTAQDSRVALQRGFRTGYSDGYMAGYRDTLDNVSKDFTSHEEYSKANRAYNKEYGSAEDYTDGYRQGFESGYDTGFEKRSFEANVPENISRRGTALPVRQPAVEQPQAAQPAVETPVPTASGDVPAAPAASSQVSDSVPSGNAENPDRSSFQPVSDAVIIIPRDTEIIVELNEPVSTERNQAGDKFTAKIVSPAEITGALIEGRVSKVTKPGRIKRRSELQLSFDRIVLTQDRWSNFSAQMTEVLPVKNDNVRRVDNEGMAVGNRSYKQDAIKIGAATGTGVTIGAIAGGPVGAAVGAGVGAAVGVGAVVIDRGKHINLARSQQLRVKTSYETQIR